MQSGITAREMMHRKLVCIKPESKLIRAAKIMAKKRFGGLPVVAGDKLVGILTERDIINKVVARGKDIRNMKVSDVMTSPARVMSHPDEDLAKVARKMSHYDVSRIPVIENGKLVGLVTNKEIARQAPHLLNYLIERIRVNEKKFEEPDAFGNCNMCGSSANLRFKNGLFMCSICSKDL